MAHRSTLPARVTVRGDRVLAQRYVSVGRVLLGSAIEQADMSGIDTLSMTRRFGDVVVRAGVNGVMPFIEIDVAAVSRTEQATDETETAAVWLPTGFVFYPASDTSPQGWGAPSTEENNDDPWAPENIAPGLAVARWTPGGQLGQVLVTQQAGAGYPLNTPTERKMVAPAFFHPVVGLRPAPAQAPPSFASEWSAYRLEYTDMPAESPGTPADQGAAMKLWKREHWALVNAHRVSIGRDPLMRPVRGYYDSAQATTECVAATGVLGHFYEGYPPTYQAEDDRGSKDGITSANFYAPNATYIDDRNVAISAAENLLAGAAVGIDVIGTDPYGLDILRVPVGESYSPQVALDWWLTSPIHTANIESAKWDFGGLSESGFPNLYTEATSLNVGLKLSYYAQHFVTRDHWIAAGNATWRSSIAALPVLSWWSFNSMSLAWETWPISFYQTYDEPNDEIDVTVYASASFTNSTPEDEGTAYSCWLQYVENAKVNVNRRSRPGLGPAVMANGRVIGYAPKAGLVWAAGMQIIDAPPDAPPTYRLVILTHHATDNPNSDTLVRGLTAKLRVWYVDLPASLGVPGLPNSPIRGVYGEEDDSWPWIVRNGPYSWRGGTLVDVTDGDTLLKYTSTWRFSPDGTKAVCLRDYGTVADITVNFRDDHGTPVPSAGLSESPFFPSHSGRFEKDTSGQRGVMLGASYVRYLELDLADPENPNVTVSGENFGARPHAMDPTYIPHSFNLYYVNAWFRPAAADYMPDGTLRFAFHVTSVYDLAYYILPDLETSSEPNVGFNTRQGVYFGEWDAWYGITGADVRWYSTMVQLPWLDETLMCPWASVLDVRDEVFASCGHPARMIDVGINGGIGGEADGYPNWLNPENQVYRVAVLTDECLACVQYPATHTMRLHRGDEVVATADAPNASADVHDRRLFPNWYEYFAHTQLLMHSAMTATYASGDNGEWAGTLLYVPQPGISMRFTTPVGAPAYPPTTVWDARIACINNCGYGWEIGTSLNFTSHAHAVDRGGTMVSSFADAGALATLTATPGANPRSLYVRFVR